MDSTKAFALSVGERRTLRPFDFLETRPASCSRFTCSTAVDCSMRHRDATSLTQREGLRINNLTISIRRWFANPATIFARPRSMEDMHRDISTYGNKSIHLSSPQASEKETGTAIFSRSGAKVHRLALGSSSRSDRNGNEWGKQCRFATLQYPWANRELQLRICFYM